MEDQFGRRVTVANVGAYVPLASPTTWASGPTCCRSSINGLGRSARRPLALLSRLRRAGADHSVQTRAALRATVRGLRRTKKSLQIADFPSTPGKNKFHEDDIFATLVLPSSAHISSWKARARRNNRMKSRSLIAPATRTWPAR